MRRVTSAASDGYVCDVVNVLSVYHVVVARVREVPT